MSDWDGVQTAVSGLAEVTTDGHLWKVRGKAFLWERPLRKYEVAELGPAMRDAPILAAMVADVAEREALIAESPQVFFTTSHFASYPAVLMWLDRLDPILLVELATEAWLVRAPVRLAQSYQAKVRPPDPGGAAQP